MFWVVIEESIIFYVFVVLYSRVEYRNKNQPTHENHLSLDITDNLIRESSTDDILSKYEIYGSTPPRTRIKNKDRDWNRKQRMEPALVAAKVKGGNGGASRMARSRINRRNTMDCALLNQMFIEDEAKRNSDKRAMQLLRESEREIKMNGAIGGGPVSLVTATSIPVNPSNTGGANTNSNTNTNNNNNKSRHSFGPDERADSIPMGFISANIPVINSTLVSFVPIIIKQQLHCVMISGIIIITFFVFCLD